MNTKCCDVIVAGTGPTRACAAAAAARRGARIVLIERYKVIEGNLTVGYADPVLGSTSKNTVRDEVCVILGVKNSDWIGEYGNVHDPEGAELTLAEFVARRKNVDVFLQCRVSDIIRDGKVVKGTKCADSEGAPYSEVAVTIGCTSNTIVSFLTGAKIEKGCADKLVQPVTLGYTIGGVGESKGIICTEDVDDAQLNGECSLDWCKKKANEGEFPRMLTVVRLYPSVRPGCRRVNTTQVNRVDITSVNSILTADLELRQQIRLPTQFLRENLSGYENRRVIGSGTTVGAYENRRVMGGYTIDIDEMAEGCRFADVVVHKALSTVGIYNPDGAGQAGPAIQYYKPHDLPCRCSPPSDLKGLLVAGWYIPGTHRACASYRVVSICVATGEAVSTAVVVSVSQYCTPRVLDIKELQKRLEPLDVELFD